MTNTWSWLERYGVSRPVGGATAICDAFVELLEKRPGEEEAIQQFLAANPFFLSEQLPHCHYVIPKFRFGGQYVSDFLLPEMTSGGTFWTFVELEPANAKLVTTKGQFAERVRGGLQQLRDWELWVEDNRDHAIRPRPNGLGLGDIAGIWTWLVVGRRANVNEEFNRLRRQATKDKGLTIMTYDRLIERYRKRAEFWDNFDPIKAIQQFASGAMPPSER